MSLLVLEPDNKIRYGNIYIHALEKKKSVFPLVITMNKFCFYFKIQLSTFFLRKKIHSLS